MDKDAAIGVFDSGFGGLTAVRELIKLLPGEDIIYFGDTGRVPYGSKSRETIKKYALQDSRFLLSMGVKYIIVACGTASAVAADTKEKLTVPMTGVVGPTAAAAARATKNGKIGVIATAATVASHAYLKSVNEISPSAQVIEQACPLFVPMVEEGCVDRDDIVVKTMVERYLSGLKRAGVDTVILGCTHYPLLTDAIRDYMGADITLINSGEQAAIYAKSELERLELLSGKKSGGSTDFYLSDDTEKFGALAEYYIGRHLDGRVERIDIEKY